jgi:hypothetical protein
VRIFIICTLQPDIIKVIKPRRIRCAGHVVHVGKRRNAYEILVGKPEGKRPLRIYRRRWEDKIKESGN